MDDWWWPLVQVLIGMAVGYLLVRLAWRQGRRQARRWPR